MDFQRSVAAADLVQLELRLFMPRRGGGEYCCLELASVEQDLCRLMGGIHSCDQQKASLGNTDDTGHR